MYLVNKMILKNNQFNQTINYKKKMRFNKHNNQINLVNRIFKVNKINQMKYTRNILMKWVCKLLNNQVIKIISQFVL